MKRLIVVFEMTKSQHGHYSGFGKERLKRWVVKRGYDVRRCWWSLAETFSEPLV